MAKRPSNPNGLLSNVWDASTDTYDHVDIKGWLDDLDDYIGKLAADRVPLGSIVAWDSPSLVATPAGDTNALAVPAGWAVCDGRSLTSSQHDFPAPFAGQTIFLPDMRGRVPMGADPNLAVKTAGVAGASVPGQKGRQGADTVTVPDHYHDHQHIHRTGGVAGVEVGPAVNDDPDDSPHTTQPYVVTDAAGTGFNLTKTAHAHQQKSLYTSSPRDPANANTRVKDAPGSDGSAITRYGTSLQKKATQPRTNAEAGGPGQTGSVTETPDGGTAGDSLTVNSYPASEGVLFIMKVKKNAGSTTP